MSIFLDAKSVAGNSKLREEIVVYLHNLFSSRKDVLAHTAKAVLSEDEYVVFDTETTGLNPKEDEILSIGAVKIKDNKILTSQTFEVYIKNSREISSKSIEIHGIRPCDLENARSGDEAIKEFLDFIEGRTLVGYYLEFDINMINKYIAPMLGIKLPNRAIEVAELHYDAQITTIPQGNIDLHFDTILKKLDVPNMGVHNAVNDAVMMAMIFLKLQGAKR